MALKSATQRIILTDRKKVMTPAIKAVMNETVLEWAQKRNIDMYATVLWTLHEQLGFGKKRLLEFFDGFVKNFDYFTENYSFDDTYAERYYLEKECGIDVEKLLKQYKMNSAKEVCPRGEKK